MSNVRAGAECDHWVMGEVDWTIKQRLRRRRKATIA